MIKKLIFLLCTLPLSLQVQHHPSLATLEEETSEGQPITTPEGQLNSHGIMKSKDRGPLSGSLLRPNATFHQPDRVKSHLPLGSLLSADQVSLRRLGHQPHLLPVRLRDDLSKTEKFLPSHRDQAHRSVKIKDVKKGEAKIRASSNLVNPINQLVMKRPRRRSKKLKRSTLRNPSWLVSANFSSSIWLLKSKNLTPNCTSEKLTRV